MNELKSEPYILTKPDFMELQSFHGRKKHVKLANIYVRVPIYLFGAGFSIWLSIACYKEHNFWMIVFPLIVLLAGVILSFFLAGHFAWLRMKNEPLFMYATTIEIDEDGIRWQNAMTQGSQAWPAIPQVSETPNTILIYSRKNMAFIIPKRAFKARDDAKVFLQTAIKLQEQAQATA